MLVRVEVMRRWAGRRRVDTGAAASDLGAATPTTQHVALRDVVQVYGQDPWWFVATGGAPSCPAGMVLGMAWWRAASGGPVLLVVWLVGGGGGW